MKKVMKKSSDLLRGMGRQLRNTVRVSIRKKLLSGFLVMVGLTLVVSAIALWSERSSLSTMTELVDVHGRIALLSEQTEVALLEARRSEKDYLLRYKDVGFEEAGEKYAGQVMEQVAEVHGSLNKIKALSERKQERQLTEDAAKAMDEYQRTFLIMVNSIEIRGHGADGLVGQFRDSVRRLERTINRAGDQSLALRLATLRRHEKDYLLNQGETYAGRVYGALGKLKTRIARSGLSKIARQDLASLAGDYKEAFTQVVELDKQVVTYIANYRGAVHKVEPLMEKIHATATEEQKIHTAAMHAKARNTTILTVGAAGAAVVLGVMIAVFLSGALTRQVNRIMDLFGEVGMGNFEARAEVISRDELGTMATSLNAMLDNTLSLIQSSEDRDAMQQAVMKLLDEISDLTQGDLTVRAEVTDNITGAIADAFNEMAEQLGRVVRDVHNASENVGSTSKDVSVSTEHLAETSEAQAVQISDAIAAINEMATSIHQVAENAAQSAKVSEQSSENAEQGAEAVQTTSEAMESIRDNVQETARAIKRLGESSQEIGNIVQIINEIADRTSILALNASIQAAMAGDAGRGFAVVAEEVQRLAERSTNSTKQIETLVTNIQSEINEAGTSMEESIQRVVEGTRLAGDARKKLEEIQDVSSNLRELIQSISMAAQQQARASENISKTMAEVGEVSTNTSAASRQTAVSMQKMTETAEKLGISVAAFKLGSGKEETNRMDAAA